MKKICVVLTAIFLLGVAKANAVELTDNLVGYWKFDNNGSDSSGDGRDLDLYGDVGFDTGLFGQALDLHENNDQYAQRPVDDEIYDFEGGEFTIQVWVNLNTLVGEQVLLEKFTGSRGLGWTLTYYPYNTCPSCWHFSTVSDMMYAGPVNVTTGDWHQIVVRREGNTFSVFYDNEEIDTKTNVNSVPNSPNPLYIGRRNPTGQVFPLDGRLDEIAIWDRALSDSEINTLFDNGEGHELIPGPAPPPTYSDDTMAPTGSVHAYPNIIWPPNNKMRTVELAGCVMDEMSMTRDGGIGVSWAELIVNGGEHIILLNGTEDELDEYGCFSVDVELRATKGNVYSVQLWASDTNPQESGGPNQGLVDSTYIRVPII